MGIRDRRGGVIGGEDDEGKELVGKVQGSETGSSEKRT